MRRREFIAIVAGTATLPALWPHVARGQRVGSMPTIGVLMSVAESDADSQARISAFRQGLAALGWKDGQNVRVEYRWAAGRPDLIEQYASELVALAPAVILANSTPVVAALQRITRSVPIVFALANDPVGLGFVQSLARPGGNISGFTFIDPGLIGKWMGLLKDVSPGIARAALLFNPTTTPFYRNFLREIEAARRSDSVELVALPTGAQAEMETNIEAFAQKPGGSLMIGPDPFTIVNIKQIAQICLKNRLPAISVYRPFVTEGGLMAYGPDTADIFRRSAEYVDRVLTGAKLAELPVQQPIKFEFIVNLKAAKSLGITMPPALLAIADQAIE